MPELPEVETAVRELRPMLVGRVINGAWAKVPRQLGSMTAKQLAKQVTGKQVKGLRGAGKYIVD